MRCPVISLAGPCNEDDGGRDGSLLLLPSLFFPLRFLIYYSSNLLLLLVVVIIMQVAPPVLYDVLPDVLAGVVADHTERSDLGPTHLPSS